LFRPFKGAIERGQGELTREEAAKILGVPFKTLQDYLLIIRFAKRYGYDFDS
jgi:hypothetical protein